MERPDRVEIPKPSGIESVPQKTLEFLRSQVSPETGIDGNYMNDMMFFKTMEFKRVLHPEVKLNMFDENDVSIEELEAGRGKNEKRVREQTAQILSSELRTYTEYIEHVLEGRPKEILIPDEKVQEQIDEIDKRVVEMRGLLRDDIEDIDLKRLNELAFEITCLIYGEEKIETYRRVFFELSTRGE